MQLCVCSDIRGRKNNGVVNLPICEVNFNHLPSIAFLGELAPSNPYGIP